MKRRVLAIICTLAMCSFTLMLGGCGGTDEAADNPDNSDAVKVTCENGVMLGKTKDSVTSFKGVPYAKPPVDDLRWKAPEAPDPSDEEIECYEFGLTACQYEWPTEPASSYPKGEDCLTLNIWEAEGASDSDEPKPVMVFFHGGAYAWGGTTDPTYDGQNFIAAHPDVILITCNYRLGLMSWADFSKVPGGEDYTDVNLGIRDHIAALEWIQKNVGGFGGDPDNVTIFGESAGAFSTTALTISPKAQGLFKRAIAESGIIHIRDRADAQEYADYIMEASGAKNMDDLLAIDGDKWMEIDAEEWIGDECCGVVGDGDVIPYEEDFDDAIAAAAENGIQLIVGTNHDEWNYFKDDMEGDTDEEKFAAWQEVNDAWIDGMKEQAGDSGASAIDELYDYELTQVPEEYAGDKDVKDALAKSAVITEAWRYEHLDFADRFADAGGDVYMYLWNVPATVDNMYKSAVHAVELAYVFNNTEDTSYCGEVDMPTAEKAQAAWIAFATDGNPSIEDVEWTKYDSTDRNTMVIEKDGWSMQSDPSKTARELLTKAFGDKPFHLW